MTGKIALITPPSHSHRTAEENLGIGYLASSLRSNGYQTVIIDGWLLGLSESEIINAVTEIKGLGIVGISCYRYSLSDVSMIVKGLKSQLPNIRIVAGGYGPTFSDLEFLKTGIDYVIRGEGESSLIFLLQFLAGKRELSEVKGLSFLDKNGSLIRISKSLPLFPEDLPLPARDTLATSMRMKNPAHISTSRGCYANCIFCSIVSFEREMKGKSQWRGRSIISIVDEIEILNAEFGVTCFKFVDDSFIEPPRNVEWAISFASELKRRKLQIRYRTQIRADRLTFDLGSRLVESGWFATSVGIENGSQIALTRMGKLSSIQQNLETLSITSRLGVYTQMGMILFDDQTTEVELVENYEFLSNQHWPVTKGIFTEMYAAQGTPYSRKLEKSHHLVPAPTGGYYYPIRAGKVSFIYNALKAWHRSHSVLYDHAINVISAPKDIPPNGYVEYHSISRKLYEMDLVFFGKALKMSNESGCDWEGFAESEISHSEPEYRRIEALLTVLDQMYGLEYNAESNPFL